jgi:hypothetical protein
MEFIIIYLLLSVIVFIDIILSIIILEFIKQAINVRERQKLVIKINYLKELRKFSLVWPFVLYKLIKENDIK